MVALAIKYNFIHTIGNFLVRSIDETIAIYFKKNLYEILCQYYSILNESSHKNKLVFIDEIQNVENPFMIICNNFSSIYPNQIKDLNLPISLSPISEFNKNINEIKSFWLSNDYSFRKKKVKDKSQIDNFILHFCRLEQNIPDVSNIPKISNFDVCNAVIIRYLSHHPSWIFQYVACYHRFTLLPEHATILTAVKIEIDNIKIELSKYKITHEYNAYSSSISVDDYYLSEYCQNELFNALLSDMTSYNCKLLDSICSFFNAVTQNGVALLSILDLINRLINQIKCDTKSIKSAKKLISVLIIVSSQNTFKKNFIEICGDNLIDLILHPDFRNNPKLLSKVSQFLCLFNNIKFPKRLCHLIAFMFIRKDESILPDALTLCSKFGEKNLTSIKNIIEKAFDNEFNKKNPSCIIIDSFLNKVPNLIQDKISSLPKLLTKIISNYRNNGIKDENSINLICLIFNTLAPKSCKDKIIFSQDEIDFNQSLTSNSSQILTSQTNHDIKINPVPEKIRKTNQDFWNLYEEHINIINEILQKDKRMINKMKFLFNFPELLSFQVRYNYFREKIENKIKNNHQNFLIIDRSNILLSSFNLMRNKTSQEWLNKFSIMFLGEKGSDAGGLTREWFNLLAQELFNTNNALFKSSENKSFIPNASSYINPDHIEYFKFAGRFIARALIQKQCVNAHLMKAFYRQILGTQLKLKDLEDYDEEIYRSLNMILDIDVEPLDLVFTIDINEFGVNKTILLKKDGDQISVTNENKTEYVSLYTNYHLRKSIIQQIDAFCEGFNSLIPHEDICFFTPNELDLLICGIPEIDVNDLKNNTVFESPYNKNHPVIIMFFNVISKWDNEKKAKLLSFITGSSQVPVRGFKDYKDRGNPINIAYVGEKNRLCVAHTCFNRLDLPAYENEEEMNKKLIRSIQECEFGLA